MPKIIPPEIKNQVIDNHFLGTTRDENAEKACISTGAVSAILSQFSVDIGHANFDGDLMSTTVGAGDLDISACDIQGVIDANHWKLVDDSATRHSPHVNNVHCT